VPFHNPNYLSPKEFLAHQAAETEGGFGAS
jgi:hypothetical protein